MKKENVFESDSPTIEMETQTLRSSQHGQQIPFVSGISPYPYSGFAINQAQAPATAPYGQQPSYGNVGGYPTQQMNPQFYHPGTVQPQQAYPYGTGYVQPFVNGPMTPGYFGNTFPNPYIANQYPGNMVNPVMPYMPGQGMNTPFAQPTPGQFTGVPTTHSNYGPSQMQASPYYQPAINVVDGQYTLVPNQYSPTTTKNGTSALKNGERDFISWLPNVNILETDRSFKIEVCVPGVTKENCRIHVDKTGILRISGTRRWNQETDAVAFTRKEFNYGTFACSFLLTENLHKDKITSSCRNGLLIVSIPKKEVNEVEDSSIYDISVN